MSELISSDGVRLHYSVHGSGPMDVILLHGMGGSSSSWGLVLPHLDPGVFRALVLDLRGHGRSKGGEARFTYAQVNADILAVADALRMPQAVVVGLSGSGKHAVWLAASAPDRVRGLVLVVPCGMGPVPLPREILAEVFDCVGRGGDTPPALAALFTEKTGAHRELIVREFARTSRAALDASAELWVHTSIEKEAAHVTQPTLVLAGAREPLYHPEFQRQTTLASLPHARMEILDCGHFMTFEEPVAVAGALGRLCASLAPTRQKETAAIQRSAS
ncbi:MAG: alpha/beta hydrolase [Opitutaceae bacterium]|nr:alpha/beta hydrolase [Opitutaceae bacterium]